MKSFSRLSLAALAGLVLAGAVAGGPRPPEPGIRLAGLGDCEKVTRDGAVPPSPRSWDPRSRTLRLHGARNEVVGAQLMLTATGAGVKDVDVEVGDLTGPSVIRAAESVELFREIYQFVENGDWSWGPKSRVLPSRRWYPEVLVPFSDPWAPGRRVGAPFDLDAANGPNQGVFLDLTIPKDARPGVYGARIRIRAADLVAAEARLELTVHGITLPTEAKIPGEPPWSSDPNDWYRMRKELAAALRR